MAEKSKEMICISAEDFAEILLLTSRDVAQELGPIGALSSFALSKFGMSVLNKLVPNGPEIIDKKLEELKKMEEN